MRVVYKNHAHMHALRQCFSYTSGMMYEFPKEPEFPDTPPDEPEGRYLVPMELKINFS